MIQSQETLILFIGAIIVAALVVTALYTQVSNTAGSTASTTAEVQKKVLSSFEVVQIYENNIYVKGVSGELNVSKIVVTVNGIPQDANVSLLRDSYDNGLLDPDDLAVITLPQPVKTSDCVMLDIDGVSATWGVCT